MTCNTTENRSGYDAYNAARDAAAARAAAQRPSEPRSPTECAGGDWWLIGCSRGAHDDALRARAQQQRSAAARDRAMTLLRSNDCQGAVNAALDTGDLQFATDVRAFCAAAPQPAQ